jgi:hypothetical protein
VASITDQPRRAALRRLYYYILSGLGLAITFVGMISLSTWLANQIFEVTWYDINLSRYELSGALSALLVGLPLWLIPWRLMQSEAARTDDFGDHARRSILRKVYLYLVLFAMVIGAMVFTGTLLYTVFNQLFSSMDSDNFAATVMRTLFSLIVDAALLVYHLQVLRQDGRMAQRSLTQLHAGYPLLVLGNDVDDLFSGAIVEAMQRSVPDVPVKIAAVSMPPDERSDGSKVVVMPLSMAINPPLDWKDWLAGYSGRRVLVPVPVEGWIWIGQADRQPQELARETAQAVRQMAEGESVRSSLNAGPWGIAGYILAGLAGLILLSVVFSIMLSALMR